MIKETKTTITSLNSQLLSQVNDRGSRKALKLKQKNSGKHIFVLDFDARTGAKAFTDLESNVNAIILNSKQNEGCQVYLRIYSPGGSVTAYANAAQQLKRLRDHGLTVFAFVDEIAASGGYMMAAVAHKIIAEPFAFVGSIGVVSQMPIFEELLNKLGIDVRTYTAGVSKRTVVPTKKPEEAAESEYKEKLAEIHSAFKSHVLEYRPNIDVNKLMEGDFYLAKNVVTEHLVDIVGDSNSYIMQAFLDGVNIYDVKTVNRKKKTGLLSHLVCMESIVDTFIEKVSTKIATSVTFDKFIK